MPFQGKAKSRFDSDAEGLEAELFVLAVGLRTLIGSWYPGEATHTDLRYGISDDVNFGEFKL